MISSLPDLRRMAVKHILRKAPADYLLRHSLCKPWVDSTHLNEMAWTDFKSLFFNFPKIRAQLDSHLAPLDPGEETVAFLAATCHEILHVLWLHKYRGVGKQQAAWRAACEYAINVEVSKLFNKQWVYTLGVMYPSDLILRDMAELKLPLTTQGFYDFLVDNPKYVPTTFGAVPCGFCNRNAPEDNKEFDPGDLIPNLHQLPTDSPERQDVIDFLTSKQEAPRKVPWEALLLGGIENAVTQEQSWSKPSRRNDLLPGWQHEKLLSFVWILDVSPSINDQMKQSFVNTLQAGINHYQDAQHRVIFFAEGVEKDFMVSPGTDLSKVEIPCGNGTCLEEVWQILNDDMPEYALVLTDLELTAVPKPHYTKVVWGIVGNRRFFDPDYGVKIVLK